MGKSLLEVNDLCVFFTAASSRVQAINHLSFQLEEGETLGIVGESGSGKSVTSLCIMGLLQQEISEASGKIYFEQQDILSLSEKERRKYRGNAMAMIFQEPMTSLNPLHTCGRQIMEPMLLHQNLKKEEAKKKAIDLLRHVGIPAPEQRFKEYPHQMSGGMRQRVMIAMALACDPKLLIADEPTTALDVTIQAQILKLMQDIQKDRQMSIIMITHDLGVVSEVCKRVMVMYAGQIVEQGNIRDILDKPYHPYTEGLIEAIPSINKQQDRLKAIKGMAPDLSDRPSGCAFHPRCPYAMDICLQKEPALIKTEHRWIRCFLHSERKSGDVSDTK